MADGGVCVFCGQKPGIFRDTTVRCGNTWQFSCMACEKELTALSELDRCRRALVRGLAAEPEKLRERIEIITEAENHRPKCLRCGATLSFMKVQELDNSPMRDSIFKEPFEVLPAYCGSCGKYEFYDPAIVRKNKYLAYLIWKDTQE
jgi:hypothetical protein